MNIVCLIKWVWWNFFLKIGRALIYQINFIKIQIITCEEIITKWNYKWMNSQLENLQLKFEKKENLWNMIMSKSYKNRKKMKVLKDCLNSLECVVSTEFRQDIIVYIYLFDSSVPSRVYPLNTLFVFFFPYFLLFIFTIIIIPFLS